METLSQSQEEVGTTVNLKVNTVVSSMSINCSSVQLKAVHPPDTSGGRLQLAGVTLSVDC